MKNENRTIAPGRPRTVLVVEKSPEIRELLRLTLEEGGIGSVIAISGGRSAMRTALRLQPDLILTGVGLSDEMDGISLTSILRKRNTRRCAICILSAWGQKVDIEKGMAAGADEYWLKPFSPSGLLARIRELLRDPLAHVDNRDISREKRGMQNG